VFSAKHFFGGLFFWTVCVQPDTAMMDYKAMRICQTAPDFSALINHHNMVCTLSNVYAATEEISISLIVG